jgi:hypothetical protein
MNAWRSAAMTDEADLIDAALGQPGSGRVRYGAAMALWRDGLISAEVLEVYRVTAAHDHRDPLQVLAERGLPAPNIYKQPPILRLYAAARDYLLALDHPGAAEVRAGFPTDPGPLRAVTPRANAVADLWLGPALRALSSTHPVLSGAIAKAAGALDWVTYDAYPLDLIGKDFANGHAFASLVGGDAPFAAEDFEMGLFLIAPDTLYRDHHHAAPELYAPLTGPHGWRFGVGRPLMAKPAHAPVWNPPHQPHLTKVGQVPFLALFVWTRNVNDLALVIPSDDWAQLETAEIV